MFPPLKSVQLAHKLAVDAEIALIKSRQARENYIQGIRDSVGDDELRHRHYDAMDAHAKATEASNRRLGIRKVQYYG